MREKFIFESREEGIKHFRNIAMGFAEQIAPVYRLVQRTWGGVRSPTVNEIEESLQELIDDFDVGEYISSGGLMLTCEKYEKTEDEEEYYTMEMSMVINHTALFENIFGEREEEDE